MRLIHSSFGKGISAVTQSSTTTSSSNDQFGGSGYSGGFGGNTVDIKGPGGGGPMRSNFATALQFQALLASMTLEDKMAIGHQIDDFIVDCEFAGTSCYSWYVASLKQTNEPQVISMSCQQSIDGFVPIT
jgi:hypothetical protein